MRRVFALVLLSGIRELLAVIGLESYELERD